MSIVGESVKRINDEYLCAAGAEAQEKRHKLGESAVRELVDWFERLPTAITYRDKGTPGLDS